MDEHVALICKKLTTHLLACLEDGCEDANTEEVGMVVDMIKDLMEAEEKYTKAVYYDHIVEAMKNKEYGEDYDVNGPIKRI